MSQQYFLAFYNVPNLIVEIKKARASLKLF